MRHGKLGGKLGRGAVALEVLDALRRREGRAKRLGWVAVKAVALRDPRVLLALLLVALVLLIVALITMAVFTIFYRGGGRSDAPSSAAGLDIPAAYLPLYHQAVAARCPKYPAMLLAAIGKVETDHGRSGLPGVASGQNEAGAAGPMQIGIGGAAGNTWAGYGVDGNGDGKVSVYDPADAIHTAAVIECAWWDKTPGDLWNAVFRYNHGPGAQPVKGDGYTTKVQDWYLRYSLANLGGAAGVRGDDYPYRHCVPSCVVTLEGGGKAALVAGATPDEYGYYLAECVSFVAHRLAQDGRTGFATLGNAFEWLGNATRRGKRASGTPRVGDVAYWARVSDDVLPFGHVAYVAAVHPNGDVLVEEYNWNLDHRYGTRVLSSAKRNLPTAYIRF